MKLKELFWLYHISHKVCFVKRSAYVENDIKRLRLTQYEIFLYVTMNNMLSYDE